MDQKLRRLQQQAKGRYWGERICSELVYLTGLLENPALLEPAVSRLEECAANSGAITKQAALDTENALKAYGAQAKSLRLICAAHAHIDMNWQWSMQETVGIVIDTFQTMLRLMKQYPGFTFTQSQASTYEIIEKFAPSMLPEIRQRVREGRWEVAATHWVEPDKNMINAESMVRHLLYTKQYLADLLELDPDTLQLDFEPDTFGHSRCIPEVLQKGGVRFMYHCRGHEAHEIYRWRAPSGSEILVHREPNWYNEPIEYPMTAFLPGFCKRNGVQTGLMVYGVGDHGGGPTRRDLEKITDMSQWPLAPDIRFGRIDEYFREIAKNMPSFPVVEGELNYVFTGCYTTQARIKQANRYGEDHLYDSEALVSLAKLAGCAAEPFADFKKAWKNVLFNHFHDILPGSGVRETREYALGLFHEADSYALGNLNRAMNAIAQQVDTSAFGIGKASASCAYGAGAGRSAVKGAKLENTLFSQGFNVTDVSRGEGDARCYTLFNTTRYDREEWMELTVWDWDLPLWETSVYTHEKEELPFDVLVSGERYWDHTYHRIVLRAKVPAFGYANYYVARAQSVRPGPQIEKNRLHSASPQNPVLESECVRAEFDLTTMALISLTDKRTHKELLGGPAQFRLVMEEDTGDFSAWITGRYGEIVNLNETCFVSQGAVRTENQRKQLSYSLRFRRSKLCVKVTLEDDLLRFSTEADWQETGTPGMPVPQLQFCAPYAYEADAIRCDIAGGYIDREPVNHDVPALLYAAPVGAEGGMMLTTDCKYGYRAVDNTLLISLLRSSHTPDPYPDTGVYHFEIGLGCVQDFHWTTLSRKAFCFAHPVFAHSNTLHRGGLPQETSLLRLAGKARVTALKPAEDGKSVILRLYQNNQAGETIRIETAHAAVTADLYEHGGERIAADGGGVRLTLAPWTVESIALSTD